VIRRYGNQGERPEKSNLVYRDSRIGDLAPTGRLSRNKLNLILIYLLIIVNVGHVSETVDQARWIGFKTKKRPLKSKTTTNPSTNHNHDLNHFDHILQRARVLIYLHLCETRCWLFWEASQYYRGISRQNVRGRLSGRPEVLINRLTRYRGCKSQPTTLLQRPLFINWFPIMLLLLHLTIIRGTPWTFYPYLNSCFLEILLGRDSNSQLPLKDPNKMPPRSIE